ncbi:ABC transporter permease [Hoylesella oralis]|uniref:ABC transporter permease n=1 Tax=Hoylesella oralis TaxID=28134 RepID=UPI0028EFCD01|nr:ABC transporter permease [Hoylesella oralis]
MILKYLIQKEFIQFRRNAFLPKLVLIYPIVIMCVMPWVMNMEVKNIRVTVVDNDHSTFSRRLLHDIEYSNYFLFNGQKGTYDEGLKDIESGDADIVTVIPKDYERNIVAGRLVPVLIAANAVNGTKGAIGASYMTSIVSTTRNTNIRALEKKISTLNLYNKKLDYKVFMIPALMGVVLMLMCGFLPALNIVGEKEAGTIEQINVTPVSKWTFILSKLIPYWIIGVFVMTACIVLSWAVYGITCEGHLLWIYLLSILLALIFSAIGLVISNYSNNMQQAMFVMWFVVVCLMLLSGLFTPVRSMPDWAQPITIANPMHYFIDGMRTVFVRGGGFSSIVHQLSVLFVFALATGSWAVWSYRKNS